MNSIAGQILLVDPCPLTSLGFSSLIKGTGFRIELATESVTEAIDFLTEPREEGLPQASATNRPPVNLIVCDFLMSDGTSKQLQTVANRIGIPLLLLSHRWNPEFAAGMMRAGAKGLIRKTCDSAEVVQLLQRVMQGESTWSRKDIRQFTGALATSRLEGHIDFPLTSREFEVLKRIADGKTNKMIADSLGIGYETVKEHVQRILLKLSVNDRTQAALAAVEAGLL